MANNIRCCPSHLKNQLLNKNLLNWLCDLRGIIKYLNFGFIFSNENTGRAKLPVASSNSTNLWKQSFKVKYYTNTNSMQKTCNYSSMLWLLYRKDVLFGSDSFLTHSHMPPSNLILKDGGDWQTENALYETIIKHQKMGRRRKFL